MIAELTPPPGIDGARLLRAIADVETENGRNNWPNVEPSWIAEGERFTVEGRIVVGTGRNVNAIVLERARRFGWLPTSSSWGPWQILYHTAADLGFQGAPWDLWTPQESGPWVCRRLQKIIDRGAVTVGDIADAWNSGTHRDANRVPEYRAKVEAAYARVA
jgi:hypothetical protein